MKQYHQISQCLKIRKIVIKKEVYLVGMTKSDLTRNNLRKDNGCLIGDEFDRNRKLAMSQYPRAIRYIKANRDEIIKSKI